MYTAKLHYAYIDNTNVHIYEKEVISTGLIRYSMAPDHERIKRVALDLLDVTKENSSKFLEAFR